VSWVTESSPQGPLKVGMRALSDAHSRLSAALLKLEASAASFQGLCSPRAGASLASLVVFHSRGPSGDGVSVPCFRTLTWEESMLTCQFHHILHSILRIGTCKQSNRMESLLRWGSSPEPQTTGYSVREDLPISPQEGTTLAPV